MQNANIWYNRNPKPQTPSPQTRRAETRDYTVSFFSKRLLEFGDQDEYGSESGLSKDFEPHDDNDERDGAGACKPELPIEYVVDSTRDFSAAPGVSKDSDCTLTVTCFKTARSGTCKRAMLLLLTQVQYASCSKTVTLKVLNSSG